MRVSFSGLARNDEAENVAIVNKEKYTLLLLPSPSSNSVSATIVCMYALYIYVVSSKRRSIHKSQRSFLRSFRAILSRKCEMNGSPGSRRHQLIPGSYRPFSRPYTAVYGSPHMRLYTRVKLVDINMGNWTTGTRGNRKDMLAKGRTGVCPVANIEGG